MGNSLVKSQLEEVSSFLGTTVNVLEEYLNQFDGIVITVSHDRYFLDKVVNQVYELSRNKMMRYSGNYSSYLEQKAANYERDLKILLLGKYSKKLV